MTEGRVEPMGLRENMTTEAVAELALREAIVADPATTVRDAVARMCDKRLGCVNFAMASRESCMEMSIPIDDNILYVIGESSVNPPPKITIFFLFLANSFSNSLDNY